MQKCAESLSMGHAATQGDPCEMTPSPPHVAMLQRMERLASPCMTHVEPAAAALRQPGSVSRPHTFLHQRGSPLAGEPDVAEAHDVVLQVVFDDLDGLLNHLLQVHLGSRTAKERE